MQAETETIVKQGETEEIAILASAGAKDPKSTRGKGDRLQEATGAFEFSTGGRNEVAIITPEISSEDVKGYLSLNIIFLGTLLVFTAGAGVEAFRFFPDALYW